MYDVFNFLCLRLESVSLSEIVLESFPDSDNLTIFKNMYRRDIESEQEMQSHLKDRQAKITTEVDISFQANILSCIK